MNSKDDFKDGSKRSHWYIKVVHTLTIITSTSSKCSSITFQVLLNNLHIFTASKVYNHAVSEMVHSPSLPKVPRHFPQSTNY